jgi:hypothetical protein
VSECCQMSCAVMHVGDTAYSILLAAHTYGQRVHKCISADIVEAQLEQFTGTQVGCGTHLPCAWVPAPLAWLACPALCQR